VYNPAVVGEDGVPPFTPSTLKKAVASDYHCIWVLKRLPGNRCHATYMVRVDIKGNVLAIIMNQSAGGALDKLRRAHTFFEKKRVEMEEKDKELDETTEVEDLDMEVSVRVREESYVNNMIKDASRK